MQYIIISGNPKDGFEHIGPFDDAADAYSYAGKWLKNIEWWLVLLQLPEEIDDDNKE